MAYALTRPARSNSGVYYEVAASPRGDLLLWFSETGPQTWTSGTVGLLGIATFIVNRIAFRRRWRVVVRHAAETRSSSPTSGLLWHADVPARDVDSVVADIVGRIEQGTFLPETAATGLP